ncbi:MAG: hypothetical protein JNK48_19945 [Bryobacterales bacterium]|nr:hypothetical protein [Bryobacterales bacterium]
MIVLALLLAVAPTAIIDRSIRVPPTETRALHFSIRNRPATLEVEFRSPQSGPPVRLIVMAQADESRFRAGRQVQLFAATPFDRGGSLRSYIATPGEYVVVVDNRAERHATANVALKGTLVYDMAPRDARYLTPRVRWMVVSSSLLFFFAVAWFAGRRLHAAMLGQRTPGPRPPFD